MNGTTTDLLDLRDALAERFTTTDNTWGGFDARLDDERTFRVVVLDGSIGLYLFVGGRAMLLSETAVMTGVSLTTLVAAANAMVQA